MTLSNKLDKFFSTPKSVLKLSIVLGIIFLIINQISNASIYNDVALYANMGHAFSVGAWSYAFSIDVPILLSIFTGLICILGFTSLTGAMFTSGIFFIVTIFPLYGILKRIMNPKLAAWGCLFYILAPKLIRFGFSGYPESLKYFFFVMGLYLLFNYFENKKFYKIVLFGVCLAGLTLSRSEGIAFYPFLVLTFLLLYLKTNSYRPTWAIIGKFIGSTIVFTVIMLAILSPRIYQLYERTGYPGTDSRQSSYIEAYMKIFEPSNSSNGVNVEISHEQTVSSNTLLTGMISLSRINYFLGVFSRGTYGLYEILALIAIILICKRRKWTLQLGILIMFLLINAIIFYLISLAYRYFLFNIIVLMPFIIIGFDRFRKEFCEYRCRTILRYFCFLKPLLTRCNLKPLFTLIIFIVALAQIYNGMLNSYDRSQSYLRESGLWIGENKELFSNPNLTNPPVIINISKQAIGYWTNLNYLNIGGGYPQPTAGILSNWILTGVSNKLLAPPIKPINPIAISKPSIIVVSEPGDYPQAVDFLKHSSLVQEINTKWNRDVLIFKVLR